MDPLFLAAPRVSTYLGSHALTNASGFFFERDERLYLVTSRHVVIDEASQHLPDRLEIELHLDAANLTRSTGFSMLLYAQGKSVWHQGRDGGSEIDVAVLALPINESGFVIQPLYDEPFIVALPKSHRWAQEKTIRSDDLRGENMLLLGAGHCFRDQVLGVCPELSRFSQSSEGIQRTFEGSSLETIRHMVASGVGITVLPSSSVPNPVPAESLLNYIPLADDDTRRTVALVWRKSFGRREALDALKECIMACDLNGVEFLDSPQMVR